MSGPGDGGRWLRVDDLEAAAARVLPRDVWDYFAGGAEDEWTLAENRRAFDRWVLRPRVLIDVGTVDVSATVMGERLPFPILLAPTAYHRLAHADGEMATGRAAAELGVTMILSTMSTVSLEEVAATGAPRWFQLYVHRDRGLTADLVRRAHAAGYTALVLTVDLPRLGRRERDGRSGFVLPSEVTLANLAGLTVPQEAHDMNMATYFAQQMDPGVTWDDIGWLRGLSPLPVVLKGVLTKEDAGLAAAAGAAAVVVSNHGGRQLDGAAAALDALPEVVEGVGGRVEVLMDGGVRRGQHILKALALGARAVLIGRPYLWGLAVDGEAGVRFVLEHLRDELMLCMALSGVRSIAEIRPELVAPARGARGRHVPGLEEEE